MKLDCLWLDDVECPYAPGYEDCDNCDKYQEDDRKHPIDDSDRDCNKYHMNKKN